MSIFDAFSAGAGEILSAPASFLTDAFGGDSGYVPDQQAAAPIQPDVPLRTSDRGPAVAPAPVNGSFTAGLSLLFQDPGGFLNTLTGSADSLPADEVRIAATQPLSKVLPKNPLPGSGTITLWLVLGVVGIAGLAFISSRV